MSFSAYLLRCADGKYFVGHSDDLERRIAQHQAGEVDGFTRERRPVELVWSQQFPSREEALAAEQQIKGWTRAKKETLIAGDWELLHLHAMRRPVLRDGPSTSSGPPQDELEFKHSVRAEEPLSEVEAASRSTAAVIVLVRPQLGQNIGKAARAMLNFGLTELRLVSPRDGWPNPEAGPAASGADVVLEKAELFDSVEAAIADCSTVFASTVRRRDLVMPVVGPEEMAREIHSGAGRSAILFGPERSGLESGDVALASHIVTVPINPEFGSLNLAQAVILLAYEWSRGQALAQPTVKDENSEPPAPMEQLESLIRRVDGDLEEVGYYFPPERAEATRATIRTVLTKPRWSTREVSAMHSIIRALADRRKR